VSSLPERPNLVHLRKQAKDLLRQSRAHDPTALASFRQHLPAAKDKSDAQTSAVAVGSAEAEAVQRRYEIAQRGYEQARPRKAVPFDPRNFDKYVGYYRLSHAPTVFTHIFRDGERFFEQLNIEERAGVAPVEFHPESETKFFTNRVASQISFQTDAQGQVTGLVFHQGGYERPAIRVDKSVVDTYEAALAQRIRDNIASPGTEATARIAAANARYRLLNFRFRGSE
jgi:hypothetical protein